MWHDLLTTNLFCCLWFFSFLFLNKTQILMIYHIITDAITNLISIWNIKSIRIFYPRSQHTNHSWSTAVSMQKHVMAKSMAVMQISVPLMKLKTALLPLQLIRHIHLHLEIWWKEVGTRAMNRFNSEVPKHQSAGNLWPTPLRKCPAKPQYLILMTWLFYRFRICF